MVSGRAPAGYTNDGRWDFATGGNDVRGTPSFNRNAAMANLAQRGYLGNSNLFGASPAQRMGIRAGDDFGQWQGGSNPRGYGQATFGQGGRNPVSQGIMAGQPDVILGNPSNRQRRPLGPQIMEDGPSRYRNRGRGIVNLNPNAPNDVVATPRSKSRDEAFERWRHKGYSGGGTPSKYLNILGGVSVPQATSALTSGQPSFEQWKAGSRSRPSGSQGQRDAQRGQQAGGYVPTYSSGTPSFEQWRSKHSARPGGRGADQGPFVDPATVPGTKPWFLAQAKQKRWPPQDKRDGQRRGVSGFIGDHKPGQRQPAPQNNPYKTYGDWGQWQTQGRPSGQGGGQGGGRQSMGWRAPTAEQRARLGALADRVLW